MDVTMIVSPNDTEMRDAQARPMLTLVTCYPFDTIGSASRRFIVVARIVQAQQAGRQTEAHPGGTIKQRPPRGS